MSWIEIIADRKIRDAQEEGAFDNLPGKGKPLNLDADARVPPELRAAYRIMKDAQVLPDWIELDKEIRTRGEKWAARIEAFAERRADDTSRSRSRADEERLDRARDLFLISAVKELRAQNDLIDRLNLIVPTPAQARVRLDVRARTGELAVRFPPFQRVGSGTEPWEELLKEERRPTQLSNRMPLKRKKGSIG